MQRVAEQRSHASTRQNLTSHATKNNAKNSNEEKAMLVVSVQGSSDLMPPSRRRTFPQPDSSLYSFTPGRLINVGFMQAKLFEGWLTSLPSNVCEFRGSMKPEKKGRNV
jgi:hypothetical protein